MPLLQTAKTSECLALVILTCLFSVQPGCRGPSESNGLGDVLRRGLSGEPSSLDPASATDTYSLQVIQDLYEGLTNEGPTGEAIPGVASSWAVDSSGTLYEFRLRHDARWSNGKTLSAQDFIASWRRVLDPKQHSPVADDLRLIKGASEIIEGKASLETLGAWAEGPDTLKIQLERPAPYFPQLLANAGAFAIFSPSSAQTHLKSEWVSNGPYLLSKWQPGTSIELIKNPVFWDKKNIKISKIQYQFTSDEDSQFARYQAGQLDITDSVPANELPRLRIEKSSELVIRPILGTAYYGLNLTEGPFGSNLYLRKALAMAIDRHRLVEAQGFGQIEAFGFVPPGTRNYRPQTWDWAGLDDKARISEARRFYSEAGYTPNTPLRIRLLYNSNVAVKRTAILVATMWKEVLGVDTVLQEEEYRVFLQSRHDMARWDVARLGWTADFNDASNFLDVLRSNSSNNDMRYRNAPFDILMDRAAALAQENDRLLLLQQAEQLILRDYPIIPLYYLVSKRLVKPYVVGVMPTPLDHVPSRYLTMRARTTD